MTFLTNGTVCLVLPAEAVVGPVADALEADAVGSAGARVAGELVRGARDRGAIAFVPAVGTIGEAGADEAEVQAEAAGGVPRIAGELSGRITC